MDVVADELEELSGGGILTDQKINKGNGNETETIGRGVKNDSPGEGGADGPEREMGRGAGLDSSGAIESGASGSGVDEAIRGGMPEEGGNRHGGSRAESGRRTAEVGENGGGRGGGSAGDRGGEQLEPSGYGDFGPIFTQFKGDAQGAIAKLTELKGGEAIGALHQKDVGDIDLVWGIEGTGHSDGMGLAKLVKYHPEVVGQL